MADQPFIVGLTGGIGSGKSSVAALLRERGVSVVDADQVARQVVQPGQPALAAIADHFGAQLLLADGGLDRAALRQIIFTDSDAKKWLEQLTHPLIGAELSRQLASAPPPYAVLESPLLLETDQHQRCAAIVVVDVTPAQQLTRAAHRDGNSEAQIQRIIDSQLPRPARLARADYIVDNSASPAALADQVELLHQRLCAAASAQQNREKRENQ